VAPVSYMFEVVVLSFFLCRDSTLFSLTKWPSALRLFLFPSGTFIYSFFVNKIRLPAVVGSPDPCTALWHHTIIHSQLLAICFFPRSRRFLSFLSLRVRSVIDFLLTMYWSGPHGHKNSVCGLFSLLFSNRSDSFPSPRQPARGLFSYKLTMFAARAALLTLFFSRKLVFFCKRPRWPNADSPILEVRTVLSFPSLLFASRDASDYCRGE